MTPRPFLARPARGDQGRHTGDGQGCHRLSAFPGRVADALAFGSDGQGLGQRQELAGRGLKYHAKGQCRCVPRRLRAREKSVISTTPFSSRSAPADHPRLAGLLGGIANQHYLRGADYPVVVDVAGGDIQLTGPSN
jgi:hypothetical protein